MKPMLAATIKDIHSLTYPLYASPKLDGIRGVVLEGKLLSRTLKPIPNKYVTALFSKEAFEGLDGELILGSPTAKDVYRMTNGACSRHDGVPDVKFHVFDKFDAPGPYTKRRCEADAICVSYSDVLTIVPQTRIDSVKQLVEYEDFRLSEGYEGVILRSLDGEYKFGRSTLNERYLMKLKRFEDGEAEVLGICEEMENTNEAKTNKLGRTERSTAKSGMVGKDTAGKLAVRDIKTGVIFSVGSGFTDDDGRFFWQQRVAGKVIQLPTGPDNRPEAYYAPKKKGKLIKYKHFAVGVKDKPRHPVYLGGREKWDL